MCFLPFILAGSVLIFVTKKANSEELAAKLKTKDFEGTFCAHVLYFGQQCLVKLLIQTLSFPLAQ